MMMPEPRFGKFQTNPPPPPRLTDGKPRGVPQPTSVVEPMMQQGKRGVAN